MRIHHVGYLVRNIERAEKEFCSLGYEVSQEIVYDEFCVSTYACPPDFGND